jgi:hypothetical protein
MNPRSLRGISVEGVAIWLALASVAVFVVWFAFRLREIVVAPYQNADLASSLLLAEFFGDKGSGTLVLGNYPWLEGLLPLHWTRWLPDHVAVWKAGPFVIYAAAVLLVGWTVKRATSWRAGLVVALAMAAPAFEVIYMLGVPNQRLPLLAHTVLLAAFLVTLPSLSGWRRPSQLLWAAGLAVTLAPAVATDQLIYPAAVLPFLGAVALGWRLRLLRPDTAGLAAAAGLAGVLGGISLGALAEDQGFVYNHGLFDMAEAGRVLSNAALLMENVALFAHGKFAEGRTEVDAYNSATALVAIAAIAATLVFGFVVARASRPILSDNARPLEQRLLFAYWGISIVAVSAGFVITTAPHGTNAVRFLMTLWPALLTLVVIVYQRRAITGVAVLAAGCAILGCFALAKGLYTPATGAPPDGREAELVERFVAENDLDHGYAGYQDAAPISVQSNFNARVYPIEPCGENVSIYCPFHSHQIESWYEPKEGARSFFVVNGTPTPPAASSPPAEWGRPFKTAQLGDLIVYAYDYDISSQFQEIKPGAWGIPAPGTE